MRALWLRVRCHLESVGIDLNRDLLGPEEHARLLREWRKRL